MIVPPLAALVTFQLPLCVYLYTNFIRGVPKELDEAALIDGCGPAATFYVAAGCLVGIMPMALLFLALLFLALQKHFVKGISEGAVKG